MKKEPTPASSVPASFHGSEVMNSEKSLSILNDFYRLVRSELKKNDSTRVTAHAECNQSNLVFICEGFNLSLIYTEGGDQ